MEAEKRSMRSNLECFLHCTTPLVPSRFLPMSEVRNLNRIWHPWERESVEHFTMNDLWNCYDEWSAYGAGVPIFHSKEETLVQYYVPYLSAIQIFTSNPPAPIFREDADLVDGDTRDSCSESCSDESESDKLSFRWDGCSSEDGGFEQESLWQLNDRLGYLYCQYIERSTPYGRAPLKDKISTLAQRYPALMSLKSVDLSPASWMSVAWYPIYHIPMGRTIKDLSTCFLTYHTLSSSFQDMDREDEIEAVGWKRKEGEGIPLPPFGLVTHKMQGSVWLSGRDGRDPERLGLLLSVANSWLKQLRVQHHDFNFFTGIRHG
ncbi:hypothetical protein Nepgr_013914 [Nepenthes gracilis]|uniref:Uncharacterized protein n=1 Tax=Nepenthes gracilis TaxID=150966 RepID=A0AAD3XPE0_NEPGR|nr:hypothetical protein Nepgr_013914 [Nepenthes gracilis]